MDICQIYVTTCVSKPIECTTPQVNPIECIDLGSSLVNKIDQPTKQPPTKWKIGQKGYVTAIHREEILKGRTECS